MAYQPPPSIACEKCKTPSAMGQDEVRAYPAAVVVLGYVLFGPAALVIVFLIAALVLGAFNATTGTPEVLVGSVFMLPALFPLAIGAFLIRKRKVWRCRVCSYAYERV